VERPSALTRALRIFTAAGALVAIGGALASPAGAGWTRPAEIAAPSGIDVLGAQTAASPRGAAAVSFNEVNVDAQATGGGFVAFASPHGGFGAARAVPGAQEVLAIAYSGPTLDLLTASAPPGQPCCSAVQVIRRGVPQTLVGRVGGGATGRLVPLANGRMLAVIAGPQRLWVTEAPRAGGFGAPRGLTRAGVAPAALAATGTPGGGASLAWTQASGSSVIGASAGPGATPSRPRVLVTGPRGHTIDGVQLVSGPSGLTLAWTESFTDAAGVYHARAYAADLTGAMRPVRIRALSGAAEVVSGLTLAGDGNGDEVAAWEACPAGSDACVVQSAVRLQAPAPARSRPRPARRRSPSRWFGPVRSLGAIDAGQSPEATMAPDRASLLGWIAGGRVVLAGMLPSAVGFGAAAPMSGGLAANLALGFGPTGQAVATWTEGTFSTGVFASVAR
jgi:hypothetical protein